MKKNTIIIIVIGLLVGFTLTLFFNGAKDNLDSQDTGFIEDDYQDSTKTVDNMDEIEEDGEKTVGNVDKKEKEEDKWTLAVDKKIPNYSLQNLNGDIVGLGEYEGHIVLINFWATWCLYCDMEMPDLEEINKYEDVKVLAVNVMEDREHVSKYIENGGYTFEVLMDIDGDVAAEFYVSSFPSTYFVNEDGIFIGRVQGLLSRDQMDEIIENIRSN